MVDSGHALAESSRVMKQLQETNEQLMDRVAKLEGDNLKLGKLAVRVRKHLLDLHLPDSLQNSLLVAGFLAECDDAIRIDRRALVAHDEDEELRRLRAWRDNAAAEEKTKMQELSALRHKAEAAIVTARGREQAAWDRLALVRTAVQGLHVHLLSGDHYRTADRKLAAVTGSLLDELSAARTGAPFYTVEADLRVYGGDQPDPPTRYVIKGRRKGTRHLYLGSVFVTDRVRWCPTEDRRKAFRCEEDTARHLARLLHARAVPLKKPSTVATPEVRNGG
jgi:hypothetical protein